MPFFPPQGTTDLQALRFRLRPNFFPPQGLGVGGGPPPPPGFLMLFEDGITMQYENPVDMDYEFIPGNWFDTDFKRRVLLTVQAPQITGTHIDYPFLFNQIFGDLVNMKSGGEDIRFVSEDGATVFPVEIQAANNGTGELTAWSKIPSISGNFEFYMYYDNPTALPLDPKQVWPIGGENYVYHMNQSPGTILDSTGNSAIQFGTQPTAVGKIGNATSFNGTTEIQTFTDPTAGHATCGNLGWMSHWVKAGGDFTDNQYVVMFNSNKWGTLLGFQDGFWNQFVYALPDITATQFPAGLDFTKIDYVITPGTPNQLAIYQDGVEIPASPFDDTNAAGRLGSVKLVFGGFGGGPSYKGIVDEFRFMDTVPSPSTISDRISTIYNNENSPSTFISIGPVHII